MITQLFKERAGTEIQVLQLTEHFFCAYNARGGPDELRVNGSQHTT